MENEDIRWHQRLSNYSKALLQLTKFVDKGEKLSELEEQGMIQSFEYTYELAWNLIKDYYEYQGPSNIQGSRDAFRLAFNRGLIDKGEQWMEMIKSRALTAHTYNEEVARKIVNLILNEYFDLFMTLQRKMLNQLNRDEI
jgi:nucleotidyltransferase substrate binding protein (TIGR01987 family)